MRSRPAAAVLDPEEGARVSWPGDVPGASVLRRPTSREMREALVLRPRRAGAGLDVDVYAPPPGGRRVQGDRPISLGAPARSVHLSPRPVSVYEREQMAGAGAGGVLRAAVFYALLPCTAAVDLVTLPVQVPVSLAAYACGGS